MQLALELMKRGSYQVEMSDEGLMNGTIEDRLNDVLLAGATCDMPTAERIAWCTAMLESDRVRYVSREPLEALRRQFQATVAR